MSRVRRQESASLTVEGPVRLRDLRELVDATKDFDESAVVTFKQEFIDDNKTNHSIKLEGK